MTEREIEQIKKLWAQGQSANRIARVFPYKEYVTRAEICRLKKEGVLPPRDVQQIRAQAVIADFAENKNLQEIADKHGISVAYIRNILSKHGISHPKTMEWNKRPTSERTQRIKQDLEKGLSLSEIAKKHQVTRQYVFRVRENMLNEQ